MLTKAIHSGYYHVDTKVDNLSLLCPRMIIFPTQGFVIRSKTLFVRL